MRRARLSMLSAKLAPSMLIVVAAVLAALVAAPGQAGAAPATQQQVDSAYRHWQSEARLYSQARVSDTNAQRRVRDAGTSLRHASSTVTRTQKRLHDAQRSHRTTARLRSHLTAAKRSRTTAQHRLTAARTSARHSAAVRAARQRSTAKAKTTYTTLATQLRVTPAATSGALPSLPSSGSSATGKFDCTAARNVVGGNELTSYQLPKVVRQRVVGTSAPAKTFAGIPLEQQIATSGNRQYLAFYDGSGRLNVGYRSLPTGAWSIVAVSGPDAVMTWDSHDTIALAIDSDGNAHVAANMHNVALRYWRTTTPGDLSTLTRIDTMVDPAVERGVTYPKFLTLKNGGLVFFYRDGSSGRGNTILDGYDTATKTWHALNSVPVFDGQNSRSAYFTLTKTANDYVLSYVWRGLGGVAANSRLSLVRTSDFRTWRTVSGQEVSLPLRYDTPGVVVDDVPEQSGLFNNQEKVGVDGAGNTTVAYAKYDSNGTMQLNVARYTPDQGWSYRTLTRWTGRWDVSGLNTLSVAFIYNAPSALPDGRTAVTYWCQDVRRTIVLDTATLTPIAERPYLSNLPGDLWGLAINSPGVNNNYIYDVTEPGSATDYYAIKWGSLGSNNDQPRSSYPAAGPITVYHIQK